jgi:hypothetical protein
MTRLTREFPTEWSFYPDDAQDDGEQPSVEENRQDPQLKIAGPQPVPAKVRAMGASASTCG